VPVGSSGVEQDPDAVVGEVPEPEGDSFDPFDEVVRGFGGGVGEVAAVPVRDGYSPPSEGPAEAADLGWPAVTFTTVTEMSRGFVSR
jgi:hypothetical protein